MTVEIPRFMEILALAKLAHELGWDESCESRKMIREFPGATPKRKHGPGRILARLERKAVKRQILLSFFTLSGHERKLLVAAYDQGVLEAHLEKEGAA